VYTRNVASAISLLLYLILHLLFHSVCLITSIWQTMEQSRSPEHHFPIEIWIEIVSYSSVQEVVHVLGMLSQNYCRFFGKSNDLLWKALLLSHYSRTLKEGKCAHKKYKEEHAYRLKSRFRQNFVAKDVVRKPCYGDEDYHMKFVLIGDMEAGKTSIYNRYLV
jgi:hypothetical protein